MVSLKIRKHSLWRPPKETCGRRCEPFVLFWESYSQDMVVLSFNACPHELCPCLASMFLKGRDFYLTSIALGLKQS